MMCDYVRLQGIKIENFKNVKFGEIDFMNSRKNFKSSILGLYGQNGSGKTTLIDAIELLKNALCNRSIPHYFLDYINVDSDYSHLSYRFAIYRDEGEYLVNYSFKLKKQKSENYDENNQNTYMYDVKIYDEIIGYSFRSEEQKINYATLINTNTEDVFIPATKYNTLIGKDKNIKVDLLVAKKLSYKMSKSFIFSPDLLNYIEKGIKDGNKSSIRHFNLLQRLRQFGFHELFIINTKDTSLISLNALPLSFKVDKKNGGQHASGHLMLSLDDAFVIPNREEQMVKKIIECMNIVLNQLIPGLIIDVRELGKELIKDELEGVRIQLVSLKNGKEIPLKYESEGIKKIISILQLLIVVYNKKQITVAIDELDSGIFEYLLGEILRIISEKGKGQLIFTSHNLRPLETLDRGFIAFTTTNPSNRYIRMSNIKDNNNLRDFYFRDIIVGDQKENLYDLTNNSEISYAFRKAGKYDD